MGRTFRSTIAAVALVAVSACVVIPRSGVVYVRRAPPAARVEVATVAPGRHMVWIDGWWAWRHDDYIWVPGHWTRVPDGYHRWIAGRWDRDRHGWFYVEGHWR